MRRMAGQQSSPSGPWVTDEGRCGAGLLLDHNVRSLREELKRDRRDDQRRHLHRKVTATPPTAEGYVYGVTTCAPGAIIGAPIIIGWVGGNWESEVQRETRSKRVRNCVPVDSGGSKPRRQPSVGKCPVAARIPVARTLEAGNRPEADTPAVEGSPARGSPGVASKESPADPL
jgi:hypothetical protein